MNQVPNMAIPFLDTKGVLAPQEMKGYHIVQQAFGKHKFFIHATELNNRQYTLKN